jgi:hypothetical protein
VHHDLIALARGPRIHTVMKRRLGEQGESIRLLLLERRLLLPSGGVSANTSFP